MREAVVAFSDEATEPAEMIFVALIGWQMTVVPEAHVDLAPFTGELESIGAGGDGHLKGIWVPVDVDGTKSDQHVMLDLYDELDRVEVL